MPNLEQITEGVSLKSLVGIREAAKSCRMKTKRQARLRVAETRPILVLPRPAEANPVERDSLHMDVSTPPADPPTPEAVDGLYRVTTSYLCAGFVVERGRVTRCAPILRKRLAYWRTVAVRLREQTAINLDGDPHGSTAH